MIVKCIICGKKFKSKPCYLYTGRGKHCSRKCASVTKSKYIPWNKGTKGIMKPNKTSFIKGTNIGHNNIMWKGKNVGYYGLHDWVYKWKGKPKKCNFCGSNKKVQWANKSFSYKRDLNDWIELCYWCHRKYDMENGWGKATQKFKKIPH